MVLKSIINLLVGFSGENAAMLVVSAALGYTLIKRIPYMNIATAVLLTCIVFTHLWDNLMNARLLYLAEAALDMLCVVTLVLPKQMREHFKNEF
jgi:ABC-type proline/glycine betaine transport system permease subunit